MDIVDISSLISLLKRKGEGRIGVLSQQSSPVAGMLIREFQERVKCLFSAEHGWCGFAAPGEKTSSSIHPVWGVMVHSLYGETRRPTDEMLEGLSTVVIDLQDLGARYYTYLASLKLMIEECSKRSIGVVVLDRPIPFQGMSDGPMREEEFSSFVAPINVPMRHGMTPGECARFIVKTMNLDAELDVIASPVKKEDTFSPWVNFMPPSPSIANWDSAALYPVTVLTEAFRAVDCDRGGAFSFRIVGAEWLDNESLAESLNEEMNEYGFSLLPYRYKSSFIAGHPVMRGVLIKVNGSRKYLPVKASVLLFSELVRRYPEEMKKDYRPDWVDKLAGTRSLRKLIENFE